MTPTMSGPREARHEAMAPATTSSAEPMEAS
jgi:hypothetical protein